MLKLGESVAVSKKVCPALQEFPRAPGSVGGGALLRYIRGGGRGSAHPRAKGRAYMSRTRYPSRVHDPVHGRGLAAR